jgi:hypothetical protein
MITDDPAYKSHLWRLAYSVDHMTDEGAVLFLQRMVRKTPQVEQLFMAKLCADAEMLRRSDPWVRALRTMRELRWSSY